MATMPTKVIDFGSYRRTVPSSPSETATGVEGRRVAQSVTTLVGPLSAEPIDVGKSAEFTGRRLTHSDLYPIRQAFRPDHITALRLLSLGVGRCQRALESMATNDTLAADTEIQKIQVLLPELFCCRTLGDGFGTIINALISAFETLAGETPNKKQIMMFGRVLRQLREKPFMSADEADEQLELLESVGLSVYPAELLDFLSSE